jgi:hypothetical protein
LSPHNLWPSPKVRKDCWISALKARYNSVE